MNKKTEKYIYKKINKNQLPNSDILLKNLSNSDILFKKYYDFVKQYNYKLIFYSKSSWNKETLNANALFGKLPIIASPEWAYQLIVNYSDELDNAFMHTLGHELTHKENDIPFFKTCLQHIQYSIKSKNKLQLKKRLNLLHGSMKFMQILEELRKLIITKNHL